MVQGQMIVMKSDGMLMIDIKTFKGREVSCARLNSCFTKPYIRSTDRSDMMPERLRNALAVVAGLFIGAMVNGGLINLGMMVVPPPVGFDMSTSEGMAAAMPHFTAMNYVFPFLAHAMGTLVGAFIASLIGVGSRMTLSIIVSIFFFFGGAYMVSVLPAPMWFNVLDLVGAYLPMAWLGATLRQKMVG